LHLWLHRRGDELLLGAVAAFLARYQGLSRAHTASDLNVFLAWCTARALDPLAARRVDVELYVRWLLEQRRFKPSTVSRRLSVVCFYRTCVIDASLDHSPAALFAGHQCRPSVAGGAVNISGAVRIGGDPVLAGRSRMGTVMQVKIAIYYAETHGMRALWCTK
jgi:hypothetical protein